jgi:hypothetical protein
MYCHFKGAVPALIKNFESFLILLAYHCVTKASTFSASMKLPTDS